MAKDPRLAGAGGAGSERDPEDVDPNSPRVVRRRPGGRLSFRVKVTHHNDKVTHHNVAVGGGILDAEGLARMYQRVNAFPGAKKVEITVPEKLTEVPGLVRAAPGGGVTETVFMTGGKEIDLTGGTGSPEWEEPKTGTGAKPAAEKMKEG
jgi:hypothetical protein